jgi:hypothetical protein
VRVIEHAPGCHVRGGLSRYKERKLLPLPPPLLLLLLLLLLALGMVAVVQWLRLSVH